MDLETGKSNRLFSYLVVSILLFATDSLWVRKQIAPVNYHVLDVIAALLIIPSFCYLFSGDKKPKRLLKNYSLAMLISAMLSLLLNYDSNFLGIFRCAMIVIGIFVCTHIEFRQFASVYVKLVILIASFSIFCMIFRKQILSLTMIQTIFSGTQEYKSLFFMNFLPITSGQLFRNPGPYWEPGAYQAFLNLALLLHLFVNQEVKGIKYYLYLLILSVTIFTSLSTTGIFVMFLIFSSYVSNKNPHKKAIKLFIVICGFSIVLLLVSNQAFSDRLFNKFILYSNSNISYTTRLNSLWLNLKIIAKDPLFGIGVSRFAHQYVTQSIQIATMDNNVNTMTSLTVWGMFGVGYFIAFNLLYIRFGSKLVVNRFSKILLVLSLFLVLNTEDWSYSLLWNILPLYATSPDFMRMTTANVQSEKVVKAE